MPPIAGAPRGLSGGPVGSMSHDGPVTSPRRRAAPAPGRSAPAVRRVAVALASSLVALCLSVGSAGTAGAVDTPTPPPVPAVTPSGAPTTSGAATVTDLRVAVGAEPDGAPVTLDASIFVPTSAGRHPAVLLAHGFGGSKDDLVDQARRLAERGFVVLTYTARGFGHSGGRIHLDDPAYEVADARALVSLLAARPEVRLDGPGDPRVGVAGGSYGGALALMLAATDQRVDTDVAMITWNDLASAFFPQNAVVAGTPTTPAEVHAISTPGPFKRLWANRFFAATTGGARASAGSGSAKDSAPGGTPANPLCGRFDPTICTQMLGAAQTGNADDALLTLMRAHSPAPLLHGLTAPTYLVQGMSDTLFGLDQSDATARALSVQGTPVAVRWMDGGHDGPSSTATQDEDSVQAWLEHYLLPETIPTTLPVPAFTYPGPLPRRATSAPLFTAPDYPGLPIPGTQNAPLAPTRWTEVGVDTPNGGATLLNPPGGSPASMTTVPGLAALLGGAGSGASSGAPGSAGAAVSSLATYPLAALPGQSVAVTTNVLPTTLNVVGSPRLRLRVTSTGTRVTLFASLWQVQGGGAANTATLPRSLVAPLTVPVTPGTPTDVTLALPAATWTLSSGSTWRVLLTSTDSAYAGPSQARADRIEVLGLSVPTIASTPVSAGSGAADTESRWLLAALAALVLAIVAVALMGRRSRAQRHTRADLTEVPLVVDSLVKTYSDGHRAVDDVSWRAEKGQVVGLLGPNGAGKTTTIRMVLGLIAPDSGSAYVLGQPVSASSAVLGRVGALVEGPGFLPHLTGRANLLAYWRATGRPLAEAELDQALSVAALGGALDRPVRTYSHGMKQRLGIAQAMLGLPELLILDEPTNGLDPPQVAAMRPILHAYAAAGRTVVISSHLLAEVEQTCSHVVVMHAGRVITAGAVADLVASSDTTVLELGPDGASPVEVAASLRSHDGIRSVDVEDDGAHGKVTVVADVARGEVVRDALDAGGDILGVGSRRHLEEVFLGVISDASGASAQGGDPGSPDAGNASLIERLRQVRAR